MWPERRNNDPIGDNVCWFTDGGSPCLRCSVKKIYWKKANGQEVGTAACALHVKAMESLGQAA